MTTPADLPPPPAPPSPAGYHELAELVGQVVEVAAVEELRGIPVLVIGGLRYMALDEWGERCATHLESAFATSQTESFTVEVVRAANDEVGLQPPATP